MQAAATAGDHGGALCMESRARIVTDFEAVAIAEVLEVPVRWLLDKE